jgi:cytochrome oxidase Cu insertion factor (SCO1/SenC/PrrC family)
MLTRWWLMSLACAVVISTAAVLVIRQERAAEAPVQTYGVVPDFVLVDQTGRTVTRHDFLDKISVVDFFYTRCTDACPLQTAQMARLQTEYARRGALQLISITVDPGHDDGQTLARYAERYGADLAHWRFLTGPRDVIYRLAVEGFHLAAIAAADERVPGMGWNLVRPSAAFAHERGQTRRIIQLAHGSYLPSSMVKRTSSAISTVSTQNNCESCDRCSTAGSRDVDDGRANRR